MRNPGLRKVDQRNHSRGNPRSRRSPNLPATRQETIRDAEGTASHGNPGPGGWACILRSDEFERELIGRDPHTTNNRMELKAAIEGLAVLEESEQEAMLALQ